MSDKVNAEAFGKLAFEHNKPISANPYDDKEGYHAWRKGWYAGELAANLALLATREPAPQRPKWGGYRPRPNYRKGS